MRRTKMTEAEKALREEEKKRRGAEKERLEIERRLPIEEESRVKTIQTFLRLLDSLTEQKRRE